MLNQINKEQKKIRSEVKKLVDLKNKLFKNIDISQPMSKKEKELTKEIAFLYSKLNQLVKEKRRLKALIEFKK